MRDPIVVLKFGSSVLENHDALPAAVLEIYREIRRGRRVVAVVSAFGSRTDELLATARHLVDEPDPASLARLLETGEAESAATLGLALDQAGVPARILDAGQIGLTTSEEILDAEPYDFDVVRLRQELMDVPVVVVPGFSGKLKNGAPALLGRGGSDLTALFLSHGLRAIECRLLKDVDGLLQVREDGTLDYGTRYATASYDECLRVGGPLIQPKAVEFAARHGLSFSIARCGSGGGTWAGPVESRFEKVDPAPAPTSVVLGGLGTVGLGVFRWLRSLPADFNVVGILVKDLGQTRPSDVPAHLLTNSVDTLLEAQPGLVIETIGGTGAAADLVHRGRALGCRVVSANKQLLAIEPELLSEISFGDGRLIASASVGGSVPALERVGALAQQENIISVEGILNGTCNFILDRVNDGVDFQTALAKAQELGLAEADPHLDVSGLDCVYKLSLLASRAFGEEVTVDRIDCEGLDGITAERLQQAAENDGELKLVATARRNANGITARVGLEILPPHHPLFGCEKEANRLVVETEGHRQVVVEGTGAGRWPTTVAVVADVLQCRRADLKCFKGLESRRAKAS
jgi:homoserine dehydrogenase